MIPGPDIVFKCPSCKGLHRRQSLKSGNALGATYFSDGKFCAPMLPNFPYFVKCRYDTCGAFFKISDTVDVGISPDFSDDDYEENPYSHKPWVKFLTVDEYLQAINIGLCKMGRVGGKKWKENILSLRRELWRVFNHRL